MIKASLADNLSATQIYGYYSAPYFCADIIAFGGETLAHLESADIKPWDRLTQDLPKNLFYDGGIDLLFVDHVNAIKEIQGSINAAYRGRGFTELYRWTNDPSIAGSSAIQGGIVPYETS